MTKFPGADFKVPAGQYSPLVLAYIGDAVFELYVRNFLVEKGNFPVEKLHKAATGRVKAQAQAQAYFEIEQFLTQDEVAIFKRGRNAKSHPPRNADMSEYKTATGLEALIGYLYMDRQFERLEEILKKIVV